MTTPVNRSPSPVIPQSTQRTAAAGPAADTTKMESAKELLEGGSFKMGVTGTSTTEDITAAFERFSDGKSAAGYASLADSVGKEFKGKLLSSVEQKMDTWLKGEGKNATKEQIAAKAKDVLMNQTVLYQTMKNSITQMANDAISRMRDTFEG